MKTIFDFKPGDQLVVRNPWCVTEERGPKETRIVKVQVIKQYPEFLLVRKQKGTRWCITNAELYQRWYGSHFPETKDSRRGPIYLASGKAG